ncbi:squamosa promoter-binding-like protein 7 [Rutidosis leptorrhynchoides]|uniref:squamosa promoter-binding-like protein 7 n=1 Tax=Rutidosis leptorrhynchoides TaxID=125765 RepID=UPI003A995095
MNNSPPPPPSSPPQSSFPMDDPSISIWDWSQFLDFNIDDHLPLPSDHPPIVPIPQELDNSIDDDLHLQNQQQVVIDSSNNNTNGRVRKRDPRMACSNFLAGRIPCACPELDAQLAAEEAEQAAPGKKKTRTVTASSRCQVPGCEVDISELKGYHKRHRVCIRCATATTVVLDGTNKRYCQQCGKFHVLSDFDEGKRSCRRKLERHNNRRRRKPSNTKVSGLQLADYDDGYDETGKGVKPTSSELAGEKLFVATDGHNNTLPSSTHVQNIQSDGVPSLAVSGETQTDEEKEKGTQSPSYCDDKSAYSSMCVTDRISFKLYDWNPAEFPRRLRHQIFQWLASMPVELEGYIRPGCTILTIFIAMPRFMWVKLSDDPVVSIHDFLASPRNLLSGRDTFFVNLNSTIFSVMKGGSSVIKIKATEKSPKLHYVQPTCFEAGKPIEFLACGSNLLQPRLRFLVSFAGKYMTNDVRVSPLCKNATSTTNSNHQFLNICVPRTELDVFGPGFIEVENESGLSNFIPILVADEEVCSEIKTMQMKYYLTLHSQDSESTSPTSSCEVAVTKFSELLVDIAWLLKQPIVEDMECDMMSSELQRFVILINFLIEYESTTVLKRVLHCRKMRIMKSGRIDGTLLQGIVNHATEVLNQRMSKKVNFGLHSRNSLKEEDGENHRDLLLPFISTVNQDMHKSETIGLLNADCVMSVTPYKEQPEKPLNRMFTYNYNTNRFFTPRPLILAVAVVTVCFGICAVVFHPQKATTIAITIRRCLFDDK